jgi:hypothetical protein
MRRTQLGALIVVPALLVTALNTATASPPKQTKVGVAGLSNADPSAFRENNVGVTTDERPTAASSTRGAVLRTVGLDIVGPLVVYRVCRSAGVPTVWSLAASGCLPGLGVLIDWLRWRTLEVVGAVVLAGIVVAIVLAVISGNQKVLLLDSAATTGAFGVAALVSLTRRRPLLFYLAQAFYGGRHSVAGLEMDDEYVRYIDARSFWRTVTLVWCAAYFLEAAAVVFVVATASTGEAVVFNRVTPTLASAVLIVWTIWWGNRLRAEKPTDGPDAASVTHEGGSEGSGGEVAG